MVMSQNHRHRVLGAEGMSPVTSLRVFLFHMRKHRLKERVRFARGCNVTRRCARARVLVCEELGPGDSQRLVNPRESRHFIGQDTKVRGDSVMHLFAW